MEHDLDPRKLWHFHGGLHLESHKQESTSTSVTPAVLANRLVLPLQQHIGEPAEPVVQVGDRVLKGQLIAAASGYVSVPLHAPTSGTVADISELPVPHPSGLSAPCIVIESDGEDMWTERKPVNYQALDPSALRNIIREAGIVGLGGAGFPSFIKLNPAGQAVDLLVLNGAECEPYITCDDMLMRERPEEVIAGARIMRHALQAGRCIIGIEDNKAEAANALRGTIGDAQDIEIIDVPTLYPAGGEKQLLKVLTGEEVPSHGLPLDIGIVCHNVATAAAVHRAIDHGEPLLSRYVTVTGSAVKAPRNLEVLIGTPISELLDQCDVRAGELRQTIMGGPMMGVTLHNPQVPVVKTTNCLLTRVKRDLDTEHTALPCIRCGRCAEVCPAKLLPQQMYWYAHAKDFDRIQDYNLFDCIECGCCAYVCPSHIPLVQYYRFAKTSIWQQERDKQKADLARRRHEFHVERLEREKREREARHRKKRAAVADKLDKGEIKEPKKAAIQAALDRVQAKKQAAGVEPGNVGNLTAQQQAKIDEIEQRRERLKEAEAGDASEETPPTPASKQESQPE